MKNPFKTLTRFELALWITSLSVIAGSAAVAGDGWLSTAASLVGVTALIFVAKGMVLGQVLTVVFAIFYGIVSFYLRYYGEMITYLLMTAPMAVVAIVTWLRHPYRDSDEVEVAPMSRAKWLLLAVSTAAVTFVFYFILRAMGNASLAVSTLSIATSFAASALTFLRSEYYAAAYAANDIVLIILWVIAAIGDISYLPMVFCFVMFFANDLYGFVNWRRMKRKQEKNA